MPMPKRLAEIHGSNDESYSPVRELVAYIQSVHTELMGDCRRLSQQPQPETQQLLLQAACRHQEEIRNSLADAADEQRAEIVDTWIQYLPAEGISEQLELLRGPSVTGEDAVAAILEIHKQLADFCERVARQLSSTQAQEFFASLANLERQTAKLLANDVNSLDEL